MDSPITAAARAMGAATRRLGLLLTTSRYHCTLVPFPKRNTPVPKPSKTIEIERVQTGVRVERRLLKVLKALADYKNMTLGDLLEGIVLHAFEGKAPFSAETLRKIGELKGIYDLDLDASASHRLRERS